MRTKKLVLAMSAALLAGSSAAPFADDGEIFRRTMSSSGGTTESPEPEGEHVYVQLMNFRVPAQAADGSLVELIYNTIDGTPPTDGVYASPVLTAKPIVGVYVYGPVITFEDFSQSGFPGHGKRDAFAAVSLDDGATWKRTNLSNSADKSSFTLTDPIPDPADPDCHVTTEPAPVAAALAASDSQGGGQGGGTGNAAAPVIEEAKWEPEDDGTGELDVDGDTGRRGRVTVTIINADTGDALCTTRSANDGEFEVECQLPEDQAPCNVAAVIGGVTSEPFPVANAPEDCNDGGGADGECTQLTEYPGDVNNIFHSVAGNKAMVAWQSKYCAAGFPGYTGGAVNDAEIIATYLGIDNTVDLYLTDVFVVGGSQGSTDYKTLEEFPGEYDGVGEVPFSCLWAARGVARENPEAPGTTEMVWFQAERLTSGRRDVNRIEVSCVAGGGCGVTWQEDPEGLRPGEGEGAGTGWAGATTNSQTEVWFSFIEWEDLDILDPESAGLTEPLPLANNVLTTGRPQPYVPMAVPVRLSNNARCSVPVDGKANYCEEAFAGPYLIKNQCVGTVDVPLGSQGNIQPICVVDSNNNDIMDFGDLPNVGNTAASRPRLNLQARDSDGDGLTDDAWVIIIHEEDKGLGRFGFLVDQVWDENIDSVGTFCGDPDTDKEDLCVEADVGKNQFYLSFALGTPQTSVVDGTAADEVDFSLVNALAGQHNLYNAPEVNWRTGTFYPPMTTLDMWDFSTDSVDLNYKIFNTEIARRAALMTQPLAKALASAEATGQDEVIMAMPLFKEGIINQGGPADIMVRRIAITVKDRCDDWAPGPGPGGVQPFLDEALGTCKVEDDGKLSDCQIAVKGEVCVEGNEGSRINLSLYSGGDENVLLCRRVAVIRVDDGTSFTGICELQDDLVNEDWGLPCTVKAVVGPGSTAGQGQVSDPIDVEYTDGLPVCVDY